MTGTATELEAKAVDWEEWVTKIRTTHYRRADYLRRTNHVVGGLAVILSAVVSAGILTSVHGSPSFHWKLAAGIVGIVASALTGLQSFYKLGETSELHRVAAAHFGAVRRELELVIMRHPESDGQLAKIAKTIDMLEVKGPGFPRGLYLSVDRGGRWARLKRRVSRLL